MNGPGAVDSARRASKGRRYFALVMLFFIPVGWIGLGAWLLTAGLGIRSHTDQVAGWPQTTGWVAGFHTDQSAGSDTPIYPPVIAFRAAGHLVTFTAPGDPDPPTVGAQARVAYNPRDPADAHDLSIGSRWEGVFFLGIGIVNSGFALLALLWWLVFVGRPSARPAAAAATVSYGRHTGDS